MKPGIIVILRKLRNENSMLKREDLKLMQMRELFHLLRIKYFIVLRGQHGRQAALCRASHLKITEVLNAAAIFGKVDPLEDLKENEICSHLIPADIPDIANLIRSLLAQRTITTIWFLENN